MEIVSHADVKWIISESMGIIMAETISHFSPVRWKLDLYHISSSSKGRHSLISVKILPNLWSVSNTSNFQTFFHRSTYIQP